jgi:hypothetical protein
MAKLIFMGSNWLQAALEAKRAAEAAEKQRLEDLRIAVENQVPMPKY